MEEMEEEKVEQVPQKTKPAKVKKEKSGNDFFKKAFCEFLPTTLCVLALFFMFLGIFISMFGANLYGVFSWFTFIGLGTTLAALIIDIVKAYQNNKLEFNVQFIVTLFTLAVIVLFATMGNGLAIGSLINSLY